jgi:hypothetical protein
MTARSAKDTPLGNDQLRQAITDFRDQQRSVLIASTAKDSTPNASYAPCISDSQHALIVYVSRLAAHTENLLTTRKASLLFIRDETDSPNLFARQRLTYQCTVNEIPSSSTEYATLLDQMTDQFGSIIKTLRQLPDFHLLRLTPSSGLYVESFGKAYHWQGALPDDSEHHIGV